MTNSDCYTTLSTPCEGVLLKEKSSKFFGYTFPVETEEEVKQIIIELRKKHENAVHFCYAYQLGTTIKKHRVNDDGEPSNSAGMPIYGQILSYNLTNVLVVVVRYFGGTKLGVSGLITAYKTTAKMAIEISEIIEKTIDVRLQINFDYKNINKVMRIIKEKKLTILDQKMEFDCQIVISTRKNNSYDIYDLFSSIYDVTIKNIS